MVKAIVTAKIVRGTRLLIIKKCPYCGKKHTHGGGDAIQPVEKFLGHRISHCDFEKGYILQLG